MRYAGNLFRTLFNTYSFFALYANVDGFVNDREQIPIEDRPEIDRWIISLLNTLVKEVDEAFNDYDITTAARKIQDFVTDNLSNWYKAQQEKILVEVWMQINYQHIRHSTPALRPLQ